MSAVETMGAPLGAGGLVPAGSPVVSGRVHLGRLRSRFYDYEIKHDPKLRRHTCPADLRPELSDEIRSMARQAFDALNCHGVARVDFILDAHQRPWCLEVNTVPGLSTQGNLATMAQAAGLAYAEIIEAIALTAFTKGTYIP